MLGYLYCSNSKMQGAVIDFESQPRSGSFGSVGYMWHCPHKVLYSWFLSFVSVPFPLWIPLPRPTTTVWVALISVSDHVLVSTDSLFGWTQQFSYYLYVNWHHHYHPAHLSPIFRLNNCITSQVFFSGYPLHIWLCFLQIRSSTLFHLYLYDLRL